MIKVVLDDLDPSQVLQIVLELRQQGLKTGVDFDFKYVPKKDDCLESSNKYTEFLFHQEKYATLFSIKYTK